MRCSCMMLVIAGCGGTSIAPVPEERDDPTAKPQAKELAADPTPMETPTPEDETDASPTPEDDCASGSWMVELVDDSDGTGWYAALALDSHGRPHLTYENGVNLRYAHRTEEGAWALDTEDLGGVGAYTALAVGPDNRVHVSAQVGNVGYAARDTDGEWRWRELVPLSPVEYTGFSSSIMVDASGNSHMSFYLFDVETRDAFAIYTHLTEEDEPEITPLGEAGFAADYTTVAAGADGTIHVVWSGYDPGDANVYYTRRAPGEEWQTELVETEARWSKFQPSLAIDAGGGTHLAYGPQELPTGTRYAFRDAGGGWIREDIDLEGRHRPAIAVGTDGTVHVSYYHHELERVRYARRESDGWNTEDIVPEATDPPNSIALEAEDRVHASFYAAGVQYATRCP